jgi:Fe-S oxidoreductase
MKGIFKAAKVNYWFMDEDKTSCCGRPLMKVGQYEAAQKLIEYNQKMIMASGAKKMVVSCPICFRIFNEDYSLPGVTIQHHSEYLLELVAEKRIPVSKQQTRAVYHDPCELGRGSGIYHQPRLLLDEYVDLIGIKNEKEKSLCCGGSLGNIKISTEQRNLITNEALGEYLSYQPEMLVTGCPLCKKTFSKNKEVPVLDIAEIVYQGLNSLPSDTLNKETQYNNRFQMIR